MTSTTQVACTGLDAELTASCKSSGRSILTEEDAKAIFKRRPALASVERYTASIISRSYQVSIKTVRDIWIGRTWYRATFHLDPSKPVCKDRLNKKPGRPRGAKDAVPRTRKWFKRAILPVIPPAPVQHCAYLIKRESQTEPQSHLAENQAEIDLDQDSLEAKIFGGTMSEFQDPFQADWVLQLELNSCPRQDASD